MKRSEWERTVEWARVVAGCIIYFDGAYLMVQENQARARGLWSLPAGHVDKGESIEEAAVRETKEETGYDVRLIAKFDVYHQSVQSAIKHVYRAEIIGGSLATHDDEILQVKWLTYAEIVQLRTCGVLRSPWIWEAVHDFQNKYARDDASSV